MKTKIASRLGFAQDQDRCYDQCKGGVIIRVRVVLVYRSGVGCEHDYSIISVSTWLRVVVLVLVLV